MFVFTCMYKHHRMGMLKEACVKYLIFGSEYEKWIGQRPFSSPFCVYKYCLYTQYKKL